MKPVLKFPAATMLLGFVAAGVQVAPLRADVVTDWNVTANALVSNDIGNNPRLRTLAMVHVAMSDAINTVQNRYTRVVAALPAAPSASAEAAAATAARQILIQIYPQQKAKIEETYAASLKAIQTSSLRPKASSWVWRWPPRCRPTVPTTAPTRPTPTARALPLEPTCRPRRRYGSNMRAPSMGAQERRPVPARPAAGLSSADWARDYNEVKSLGGTKSTAEPLSRPRR